MVNKNVSLNQIASKVAGFLSDHIRVDQLILFGSYNDGRPREDSDIDIAVISEDFERMRILDKIDLFAKTSLAVDSRLELVGFPKNKFMNPDPCSLLEVIKRKGKILIPS